MISRRSLFRGIPAACAAIASVAVGGGNEAAALLDVIRDETPEGRPRAWIEYRTENAGAPWVCRTRSGLWLAYRTREMARDRLPDVAFFEGRQWTAAERERMARA